MTTMTPSISVIIPTYNYSATLPRAVASAYSQLGENHELLVIDDGSTDETPVVTMRLSEAHSLRTRFLRKPNGGPSSARNLGICESAGDYLLFLDADDELLPDALQKLVEHLKQHPDSCFVIGGHIAQAPDGRRRTWLPPPIPDSPCARVQAYLIDKTLAISNGACLMHRDIFALGNYPETFRSAEDIPLFCQALANFTCTVLRTPLAIIHKHSDSLRHQSAHAMAAGLVLVDEIFRTERMQGQCQSLKPQVELQRCLSLFRTAYIDGDIRAAKNFFREALLRDWRIIFRLSYSRKALRLWLCSRKGCSQ